jgi:hypothetical protein
MRHFGRASLLAVTLVLTMGTTALACPSTSRIPFSGTGTIVGVLDPGIEKDAGDTVYVHGLVLSNVMDVGNPMLDGPFAVTVDMVRSPNVNVWWGTELYTPSAYPGEGFRCSATGGWDANGALFAREHCHGYGRHLGGWEMRSFVSNNDQVTGLLTHPGH